MYTIWFTLETGKVTSYEAPIKDCQALWDMLANNPKAELLCTRP